MTSGQADNAYMQKMHTADRGPMRPFQGSSLLFIHVKCVLQLTNSTFKRDDMFPNNDKQRQSPRK